MTTNKTVIVADDTAFVRDRFKGALQSAGHRPTTVANANELMTQIRTYKGLVDLEPLAESDDEIIRLLMGRHIQLTGSEHAATLLMNWTETRKQFVKVMPRDYKRVLTAEAAARAQGRTVEFAELVG